MVTFFGIAAGAGCRRSSVRGHSRNSGDNRRSGWVFIDAIERAQQRKSVPVKQQQLEHKPECNRLDGHISDNTF